GIIPWSEDRVPILPLLALTQDVPVFAPECLQVPPALQDFLVEFTLNRAPFALQPMPNDAVRVWRMLAFRHETQDVLAQLAHLVRHRGRAFGAHEASPHEFTLNGGEPVIEARGRVRVQCPQEVVDVHATLHARVLTSKTVSYWKRTRGAGCRLV